jgi:hypothetical protein
MSQLHPSRRRHIECGALPDDLYVPPGPLAAAVHRTCSARRRDQRLDGRQEHRSLSQPTSHRHPRWQPLECRPGSPHPHSAASTWASMSSLTATRTIPTSPRARLSPWRCRRRPTTRPSMEFRRICDLAIRSGSKGDLLRTLTATSGAKPVTPGVRASALKWRMGWDSNPRVTCATAGFQDRCLKPLGHPSRACGEIRSASALRRGGQLPKIRH